MATNTPEEIEILYFQSKQVTTDLYEIREKFKVLRDGVCNCKPEHLDEYRSYFQTSIEELCRIANGFQKRFLGEGKDSPRKDKQHEEMISRYEKKIDDLKKELLLESKAKDEALMKVSALASQLLKSGNPDISDISDRNRPTRLAEDFKNLYDDEWTDAFEYLTEEKKYKEEQATDILYDLLKICNDLAKAGLDTQYKRLEGLVTTPDVFDTSKMPVVQQSAGSPQVSRRRQKTHDQNFSKTVGGFSSQEFRKSVLGESGFGDKSATSHLESQFMQLRKDIATDVLNNFSEQALVFAVKLQTKLPEDDLLHLGMKPYLMKCFRICWYMGVQFPPMEIDFTHKVGEPYKTELFKVYNKSGAKFSQIVWPPIFLHHNGPSAGVGYANGAE